MKTLKGSDRLRDAYPKMNDNFSKLDDDKVDKVAGKGLSDENYTAEEKGKVANIPADTNEELGEITTQLAQTALDVEAIYATLAEEGDDWEVSE